MKYIHGKEKPGRASAGAIIRIILGALLLLVFLLMIVANIVDYTFDSPSLIIVSALTFGAGGALLLLFAVKSLKRSLKTIPMRDPYKNEPLDPMNPFFTVSCPTCGTMFDYQKSDLGFRAWYPNGYVTCPDCKNPIRHNAQENVYQTYEQGNYHNI